MQRAIMVRPDTELELGDGRLLEVASRESVLQAFADLEALLHVAGGCATIVTQRAETDVPGERVTVAAVIQWKDRTDSERPQPEQTGALFAPAPPAAPVAQDAPQAAFEGQPIALTQADLEAVLAARADAEEAQARAELEANAAVAPPVLQPEEAMRAIQEGIPQAPPAVHPDVPHDPDAEDVSEIPESVR